MTMSNVYIVLESAYDWSDDSTVVYKVVSTDARAQQICDEAKTTNDRVREAHPLAYRYDYSFDMYEVED